MHQVDGARVLRFAAPITFQNREIGRVLLGLPQAPFRRVARSSIWMLAVLMAVTYLLGKLLARPIGTIIAALGEIEDGNLDHRIGVKRNDEFGRLFRAFDRMADALQGKGKGEEDSDAPAQPPAPS